MRLLGGRPVDLLLLDATTVRAASAIKLLRQVRARSELPVIVLSEARDDPRRLLFFDAGADDCVPHPVDVAELTRRVRAVTAEQVRSVAQRLFPDERLNVAVLVPDPTRRAGPVPAGPRPVLGRH